MSIYTHTKREPCISIRTHWHITIANSYMHCTPDTTAAGTATTYHHAMLALPCVCIHWTGQLDCCNLEGQLSKRSFLFLLGLYMQTENVSVHHRGCWVTGHLIHGCTVLLYIVLTRGVWQVKADTLTCLYGYDQRTDQIRSLSFYVGKVTGWAKYCKQTA